MTELLILTNELYLIIILYNSALWNNQQKSADFDLTPLDQTITILIL